MALLTAMVALLPWLHENCFRGSSDRLMFPSCVLACTLILLCASCCFTVVSSGFCTQAFLGEDGSRYIEKEVPQLTTTQYGPDGNFSPGADTICAHGWRLCLDRRCPPVNAGAAASAVVTRPGLSPHYTDQRGFQW